MMDEQIRQIVRNELDTILAELERTVNEGHQEGFVADAFKVFCNAMRSVILYRNWNAK